MILSCLVWTVMKLPMLPQRNTREIAAEFEIPLYVQRVIDPGQASEVTFEEGGVSPLQLRTAAMALLRHGPRMPPNRHDELTEIVKRYYGGREISEEDLERALLVGMSPHERRLFEKRGYSFKHLDRGAAVETVQENHGDCTPTMGVVDTLNFTALDGSSANEATSNGVGRELIMVKDDVENPSVSSDVGIDGAVSVISTEHVSTDENSGSNELSASAVNPDDSCLSRRTPNGIGDLSPRDVEESTQAKHNSKLSLLGH